MHLVTLLHRGLQTPVIAMAHRDLPSCVKRLSPQGMVGVPRLPELQESLDKALRGAQGGTVGVFVLDDSYGFLPTQGIL